MSTHGYWYLVCCYDKFFKAELIVVFDDDPQAFFEVLQVSNANGLPDQTRHAVAPLVVQAFDQAGLSAAFAAGPVLPRSEQLGVSFVEVGVDQFATIIAWQCEPELPQSRKRAVADAKAHDLMCQARDSEPEILVTPLEAKANHQFIQFQRIARNSRQKRVGKPQPGLARFFLSTARTVVRPAPKVRAMARCDKRSPSALTISPSFSALKVQLRASGDHVLRHTWQRKRCLPPRVKPKRTTGSVRSQCGHA